MSATAVPKMAVSVKLLTSTTYQTALARPRAMAIKPQQLQQKKARQKLELGLFVLSWQQLLLHSTPERPTYTSPPRGISLFAYRIKWMTVRRTPIFRSQPACTTKPKCSLLFVAAVFENKEMILDIIIHLPPSGFPHFETRK